MSGGQRFRVGDRVRAGEPGTESEDFGEVIEVRGDYVLIAWAVAEEVMEERADDPAITKATGGGR